RREVDADAAAALHRHGALLQVLEDRLDRIFDVAHDEAVEERRPARRSRTGEDSSRGKKLEAGERVTKGLLVLAAVPAAALDARDGRRDAAPGLVDRRLGRAVRSNMPVLR